MLAQFVLHCRGELSKKTEIDSELKFIPRAA